jgi:outer membrane protein assembly factor BamE (lipoprotein component of BamABCDE complex)
MGLPQRQINRQNSWPVIVPENWRPPGKYRDCDNTLMRMLRTVLLLAAAGMILSLVAACEARQNTRGNLPTQDQIALITPGVHGRDDVRSILGAPSIVSTFDENVWYYIGRRTSQYAFFERNIIEQQVLIVRFQPDGPVKGITRLDKSDGREVDLVERETPSAGRELGLLEQLFGNIGRFAGDDSGGQ